MNACDRIINLCEESDRETGSDLRVILTSLEKDKAKPEAMVDAIEDDPLFKKWVKSNVGRDVLGWVKSGKWKKDLPEGYEVQDRPVKKNKTGDIMMKSGPPHPFAEEDDPQEIDDEQELKQYATKLGKKAFGDKFDPDRMERMIKGLMDKYKGDDGKPDFGAVVGALQQSFD